MEIGLFIPCYVNQFYPKVGIATLELLEKCGVKVHYPPNQTCCGQPLANSGMEQEAKGIYRHFVDVFAQYEYVVAPSGSCVYHVRKHYDVIEQTPEVAHLRKNTLDLAEFLCDILPPGRFSKPFAHRVGLHQSCHGLRGLRLAQDSEQMLPHFSKWEQLLHQVPDLDLFSLDFPDECCGFGGTFSITEPDVSVKMGKDKAAGFLQSGAEYITSGDMSCLMHLEGIIRRRNMPLKTIHFSEILNQAL
jgi:L-lactate dehydrogenase complex protein LldE